jgi:hypothetical protein
VRAPPARGRGKKPELVTGRAVVSRGAGGPLAVRAPLATGVTMKKTGLGWCAAAALGVGCSAPPLPTAAIEPGPAPGLECVTLRLPPAAASSAPPPITLLCDPRGPAGRRCEVVAPPPPPPAPAPPRSS